MLKTRNLQSICISCRLNLAISRATKARFQPPAQFVPQYLLTTALQSSAYQRAFSTTSTREQAERLLTTDSTAIPASSVDRLHIEVNVRNARQRFGDVLPREYLSAEEYAVYERLYGTPVSVDSVEEYQQLDVAPEIIEEEQPDGSAVLLRRGEDGELEEIEFFEKPGASKETESVEEDKQFMTPEEWEEYREQKAQTYHDEVYEQSLIQQEAADAWEDTEDAQEDDDFMRAHPLTIAGRSRPSPSTVYLPKEALVDPTTLLLTRANHKHLAESTNRIFGGQGLPLSASTLPARLGKEQKAIPLDPSQADMGNIEADAYMASVQPGTYASVMSALIEVRRRLGTIWIERLLKKKNGGMILDAGSGGVGVLAWHEILQAEWQRMHEESGNTSQDPTPLGKATVLTASNTLRHRASRLLENTTFIPRLPELVSPADEATSQQPRKVYDLIIAPHTLWSLKQPYLRKEQTEKLWTLLNPKGGVLILLEKGLPRGFEVIAAAREHLLDKHISSPHSTTLETSVESQVSNPDQETRFIEKETGMIIAPCTNHKPCPMYQTPGVSQGREDFCFFSQRYIRPPYLQRILNAKDKNHEDVQFSYLAVQRGRDQRLPEHDLVGKGVIQSEETTAAAFSGHEWKPVSESDTNPEANVELTSVDDVNPLEFPRLILPALKRRGHIILDVCTPAGTLERWTVPRSFSKQAFRDARKARWGDLWALGAKTRIPRNVRLGRPTDEFDKKGRKVRKAKQVVVELGVGEKDGQAVEESVGTRMVRGDRDGRYSMDRKIRGSGGRKGRKKNVELLDGL